MRNLLTMTLFAVRQLTKMPIMYLTFFIYPVLLPMIIGYLTHYNFSGGITSYEYYSHGMMLVLFLVSGLSGTFNLLEDSQKAGNMRLIYAPVSRLSICFSQILASFIFGLTGAGCAMLFFRYVIHVSYNGQALLIFASYAALIFCSAAFAVFLCTIITSAETIDLLFNLLMAVFGILGGAFFPFEALGKVPAAMAKASPVKWLFDGILGSIYDGNTTLLPPLILLLAGIGIFFAVLCRFTMKTEKWI